MEAHEKALYIGHFSVIYNERIKGKLWIQQWAGHKYTPLLWTDPCCSHSRDGELIYQAGK